MHVGRMQDTAVIVIIVDVLGLAEFGQISGGGEADIVLNTQLVRDDIVRAGF